MTALTNQKIQVSYGDLNQVSNSGLGIDSTLRNISSGLGTNAAFQISTTAAKATGTFAVTGASTYTGTATFNGAVIFNGAVTLPLITPANGGTGVANNSANTLTFSGNYSLGLTLTANTAVTLPTSGTLITNSVATLSSLTSIGTIATGTWQGTKIGLLYGGTNTDLSATGGTGRVLKQATVGGNITVAQVAASEVTGLATSATTDTTSATNITSGSLAYARLASIPSFKAVGTSQSITVSTQVLAVFGTVEFDKLSNYTNTAGNYKFTAPAAGVYRIHAVVLHPYASGSNATISIYKNNVLYQQSAYNIGVNCTSLDMSIDVLTPLSATDFVQIYIFSDNGTALSFTNREFSVNFVSN